jgi:hypothetical protein
MTHLLTGARSTRERRRAWRYRFSAERVRLLLAGVRPCAWRRRRFKRGMLLSKDDAGNGSITRQKRRPLRRCRRPCDGRGLERKLSRKSARAPHSTCDVELGYYVCAFHHDIATNFTSVHNHHQRNKRDRQDCPQEDTLV